MTESRAVTRPSEGERGRGLVVVLGMHRSGTSALARALTAFHVHLGGRLVAGIPGQNDKGFFEDSEIVELNTQMLRAFGREWHSLVPLSTEEVHGLNREGFMGRALSLLRARLRETSQVFGFKDPRTAMLLPFWREVFSRGKLPVRFLLVIRNPLSVAASLAKRDGFSPERSYWLWAAHVISSLSHTDGEARSLLDFDVFMDSPAKAMARIGAELLLTLDAGEGEAYVSRFLDGSLRHTEFSVSDLEMDHLCPALVREIYSTLNAHILAGKRIDTRDFSTTIARWAEEYNRAIPALGWAERLLLRVDGLQDSLSKRDRDVRATLSGILTSDGETFARSFDRDEYRNRHTDVHAAGVDPYRHFVASGLSEGRLSWDESLALLGKTLIALQQELRQRESEMLMREEQFAAERQDARDQAQQSRQLIEAQSRELSAVRVKRDEDAKERIADRERMASQLAEVANTRDTALAKSVAELTGAVIELSATREGAWAAKLQALKSELKADLQAGTDAVERVLRRVDDLVTGISELRSSSAARDAQMAAGNQFYHDRIEKLTDLSNAQMNELRATIGRIESEFSEYEMDLQDRALTANGALSELREEIAQASLKVADCERSVQTLRESQGERDWELRAQLKEQGARLLLEIGGTAGALDAMRHSLVKGQADLAEAYEHRASAVEGTLAELRADIAQLTKRIVDCDGSLMELRSSQNDRAEELHALRAQSTFLASAATRADSRVAELERTLGIREEQLSRIRTRVASTLQQAAGATEPISAKPIRPAKTASELLAHDGQPFVRCVYQTLLGREADPEGFRFYYSQIMSGSPKLQVIKEVLESEEGRRMTVQIPGLREAIERFSVAQSPVRRLFYRGMAREDLVSAVQNRLRAVEQVTNESVTSLKQAYTAIGAILTEFGGKTIEVSRDTPSPAMLALAPAPPTQVGDQELLTADGQWEWADYRSVKDRILEVKKSVRERFVPRPPELIAVQPGCEESVVSEVALPSPTDSPEVSIVIPVFNNLRVTLECLLSISRYADSSLTYEVIVLDDASTDDTARILSAVPNLRVFSNPVNVGFLRNSNQAIQHVRGRYTVLLNNDVQVTSGWLTTLLGTFKDFPKVGAVGPRFLYPSGHLQEAGASLRHDGTAEMIGLNEDPDQMRFSYVRRVDYVSGACLMLPTSLLKELQGFSEDFVPCYCEDSDLCLRIQEEGYYVYCNPEATIVHHLSKTTASLNSDFKFRCVSKSLATFAKKWADTLEARADPRVIAFYLPQFHPFPENDAWWGPGFTEWTNVTKARPNFIGHYQPRSPADLGFYDLRLPEVMVQQAELARGAGVDGFCFYYYWFAGKRLLHAPLEEMLRSRSPDFPFCLCWANENWSRRWDGRDAEILIAQKHSPEDDIAVIADLCRYFDDDRYIRVDGRPLLMVYRVQLFPNFSETAKRWRAYCHARGLGEIYIVLVESFELVHAQTHPSVYGCDASVEFPPQELAEPTGPSGAIVNTHFQGNVADLRDLAVRFATRTIPPYTRFFGVAPGWDNTARMQDRSFCFENATPGVFQAWLEEALESSRLQYYGDERLVFINAWNEWAEGTYLEPDRRFGHSFLDAVRNAKDSVRLLRRDKYSLGD